MSEPMSESELAAIRARADAAAGAPWTVDGFRIYWGDDFPLVEAVEEGEFHGGHVLRALAFIAAARADVPRLLDEIARLRAQVAGHCERIAKQSDALSKRAERPVEPTDLGDD
jgi:hypothetical protein